MTDHPISHPPTAGRPLPLLELSGLQVHFPVRKGLLRRQVGVVRAVKQVSFSIDPGETLGLVGESGCGKSTVAQSLLRLIRPTRGRAMFSPEGKPLDLFAMPERELRGVRRHLQLVFQNPDLAMNPRMRAFDVIAEPLRIQRKLSPAAIRDRVAELLEAVGLSESVGSRPPGMFSGGQRQRLVIARALALAPRLIIADEPVSALDVSIQAQILNLLNDLKRRFGLTYLFIAHNLEVVRFMSDHIAVMYMGHIVEIGKADDVYYHPLHPYTELLLSAIPVADPHIQRSRRASAAKGEIGKLPEEPRGCPFASRCPYAAPLCQIDFPPLRQIEGDHSAACHFATDLHLEGGSHAPAQ